jgi:DNA replication protein DnaC
MRLEFRPCRKCNNGYIFTETEAGTVATKCSCYKKFQEKKKMEIELLAGKVPLSIVPGSILEYDLERDYIGEASRKAIVPKLIKFVEKFDQVFYDKILYFAGKMGTQKTTIACWIAKELAQRGKKVNYIIMNDLIRLLQDKDFKQELLPYANRLLITDFLIIDRAFDKEQVTLYKSNYQLPFLDSFLRSRIEQHAKSTCIISNSEMESISEHGFSEDSQDFILRKVQQFQTLFIFKDRYTQKDDFVIENLWD